MGEATYYAKIQYNTEGEVKIIFPIVERFIAEGQKAHDFWQDHRNNYPTFWAEFKQQFPMVYDYLKEINMVDGDYNNLLAGQLDFGVDETPEEHGDCIHFVATVWHFAEWDHWLKFIGRATNAIAIGYVSDENVNPMDAVEMEIL